jgi:hypothetical protein
MKGSDSPNRGNQLPSRNHIAARLLAPVNIWSAAVLLAFLVATPVRARAQDNVVKQSNEGAVMEWVPTVAELYLVPQRGVQIKLDSHPPSITSDLIDQALHFTLNPTKRYEPVPILSDWQEYQDNLTNHDEHASAVLTAEDQGQQRLFLHRAWDEGKMAGYAQSVRLLVHWRLDVPQERLPIPNQPVGPDRRALVLQNVKITAMQVTIILLEGVSANGKGGTPRSPEELKVSPAAATIGTPPLSAAEYTPRAEAVTEGDKLNGVISVALAADLEVGKGLGVDPPQKQTVKAEIRVTVAKMHAHIDVLERSGQRK